MNIMYYVLSAVLMGICFCVGVLTEKHFADKEIEMLKTRRVRPAKVCKLTKAESVDFPSTKRIR